MTCQCRFSGKLKKIYIKLTGYSYTNLGRLFLRLFLGVMLFQFGVRQLVHFNEIVSGVPDVLWMDGRTALIVMICLEFVCPMFIMFGFLTRLMCLPLFAAFTTIAVMNLPNQSDAIWQLSWQRTEYLPVMFLGIIFFMLLTGPGKISIDYFLSLHFIHTANESEEELEEV